MGAILIFIEWQTTSTFSPLFISSTLNILSILFRYPFFFTFTWYRSFLPWKSHNINFVLRTIIDVDACHTTRKVGSSYHNIVRNKGLTSLSLLHSMNWFKKWGVEDPLELLGNAMK